MATKKMILDLDTGIDDSLAIAYALAAPDVDLIGIIGSYGNVYVKDGGINALKILELLGATDVQFTSVKVTPLQVTTLTEWLLVHESTVKTGSVKLNYQNPPANLKRNPVLIS